MNRAACLWRGAIDVAADGTVAVPQGPGLGYEPDLRSWSNIACLERPGRASRVIARSDSDEAMTG